MKTRYRLIRRGIRNNAFYCVDTTTGKRTSLGTADKDTACQIIAAKNQAERQPVLNLQIRQSCGSATTPSARSHTWERSDAKIPIPCAGKDWPCGNRRV